MHFNSITIGSKNHKSDGTVLKFAPRKQFYATFQIILPKGKYLQIFDSPNISFGKLIRYFWNSCIEYDNFRKKRLLYLPHTRWKKYSTPFLFGFGVLEPKIYYNWRPKTEVQKSHQHWLYVVVINTRNLCQVLWQHSIVINQTTFILHNSIWNLKPETFPSLITGIPI